MLNQSPSLARRFAADRRGTIAIIFALAFIPVLGLAGAAIDFTRAHTARTKLQYALDAAVLAAGSASDMSEDDRIAYGKQMFDANFPVGGFGVPQAPIITVHNDGVITGRVDATIDTSILGLFGLDTFDISASNEVLLSSINLEIALVLDVTGSMSGQRIRDLRDAATDLVDIVVWDNQGDFYSKVALIPYSMGVNVGGHAGQMRGPIAEPKAMTGATDTNPVVVTSNNHGFSNGDYVYITGVNGMRELNDEVFRVANRTNDTFELSGVNGRRYRNYSSGGLIHCTTPGCAYHRFTNAEGRTEVFPISTCVSERTGANAYSDEPPSTTFVGRNYVSSGNPCPSSTITPLSSNKGMLKDRISELPAEGSTAGQIGIAWGGYLLSPTFASYWPAESRPDDYDAPKLAKVAVIMTDGEFNTTYCNGVISRDSTSGSGASSQHINCNAPNGNAFGQALDLCDGMKESGILVFTVGFNVGDQQQTQDMLTQCATSPQNVFMASGGSELRQAFRDIAREISQLRLTR